jgi:predicted dehydrogenase
MSDLSPQRPLNVAVIGCGMLARAQHIPNIQRCPATRLHTCCDLDETTLRRLQAQHPGLKITTDFRAAVADPAVDLLVVATTEHFRIPIFEAAAAARKPVYTEKPMAASLAEARHTRDLVAAAGMPCPWRYQRPGWEYLRDLVGHEEEQPAISIRINDDWMSWKSVHLQGANAEYGLLLSEMTHFADLACWFADARPRRVGVLSSGVLNHATTIEFEGGGIASILMAAHGTFAYPKELLEAFGRGGVVVVDHMLEVRTAGIADAPARKTYPILNDAHPHLGSQGGFAGWFEKRHAARDESMREGNGDWIIAAEPDKGHARMLDAFVEEIRGERSAPVSPAATAVQAIEICTAAIRSFRERRFVDLAELAAAS